MSDLQDLERRLKILEDERAIQTTLYEYGHSIDYGLKEKFAGLFTEDALYQVLSRGVPIPSLGGVSQPPSGIKGRDVILQYVRGHTNAPNMWHKHFMVEPLIRFEDEDHASVESYFARLDEDAKGAYIIAFGRYRDRLVRCPDGKWRFSERICESENRYAAR
jgi:hypothetical protein